MTRAMQAIYAEPIKSELIGQRVAEIREAGVPAAGALSPQNPRRTPRRSSTPASTSS